MKSKYRISQVDINRYIIEKKVQYIKGCFWNKKEITEWIPCTKEGTPIPSVRYQHYVKKYKSIKKAKKQYNFIKSQPTYIDLV